MGKDIWKLATDIRKEADRFEETLCDANGDTDGIEADIKGHIEELEYYIQEVKEEMGID